MILSLLYHDELVAHREVDPRDIHICWNWMPPRMPGNLYMVVCDGPTVRIVWQWREGDLTPKWREQPSITVRPGETTPLRDGWAIRGELPQPLSLFDEVTA